MKGKFIKVFLPGESPWAEVMEEADGMVLARIDNKLFHESAPEDQRAFTGEQFGTADPLPKLHDYKQNDKVWCEKDEHDCWVPCVTTGVQ